MNFKLLLRFVPGLVGWLARSSLQAIKDSANGWDDRRARELYEIAGAYQRLYEEINQSVPAVDTSSSVSPHA